MKDKVMMELSLVLENSKLKEDMGIESLHFAKCTFNILTIDYYRESFTEDGELEPYTVVILDTGILLTVDKPYEEFKYIYNKAIKEYEQ